MVAYKFLEKNRILQLLNTLFSFTSNFFPIYFYEQLFEYQAIKKLFNMVLIYKEYQELLPNQTNKYQILQAKGQTYFDLILFQSIDNN
jgi:hypothetical protein